jgi:hypothetical protein
MAERRGENWCLPELALDRSPFLHEPGIYFEAG